MSGGASKREIDRKKEFAARALISRQALSRYLCRCARAHNGRRDCPAVSRAPASFSFSGCIFHLIGAGEERRKRGGGGEVICWIGTGGLLSEVVFF